MKDLIDDYWGTTDSAASDIDKNNVLNKYKDMASTRSDFNTISTNKFMLPTMGEMVQEDLMSEILQQYTIDEETGEPVADEKEVLDRAFYTEQPFSTVPGYHPEEAAFILRASRLGEDLFCWEYNKMDGDTTYYNLNDLDDGNNSFTLTNNQTYNNFKEYFKSLGGGGSLTIRHLGLNTPEIPHLELQAVPKGNNGINSYNVETKKFSEVKNMIKAGKDVKYLKYPIVKGKATKRNDNENIKLLKMYTEDNKTYYREITEEVSASKVLSANKEYNYYTIVSEDESEFNTIEDGYKCQRALKEKLESAGEIIIMLNAKGLTMGKTSGTTLKTFNSLYYADDTVRYMLNEWDKSYMDLHETNHTYKPYGTDTYGRSLGAVYVKEGDQWINVNKYVISQSEHTVVNPDYNGSPELQAIGSGLSDAFKLWSYDRSNIE
ncbi:hypothetical protein [Paraclostridium dentum]|uniref:hypothetical protein n=1 Tax=Paraclostridium dentum TaxID=2662455 RepID=UPI003F334147